MIQNCAQVKGVQPYDTIIIGGSSGAMTGINTIVKALPEGFSSTIIIALHLSADTEVMIAEGSLLRNHLPVTAIQDKQKLESGNIYIVPGNYHCYLEQDRSFSLSMDEPVHFCRPSIDILFESVANSLRGNCIGILLSGANEDGAQGLLALQRSGAYTLAQSVESSTAREMPSAAKNLNAADFIGTPEQIVEKVLRLQSMRLKQNHQV